MRHSQLPIVVASMILLAACQSGSSDPKDEAQPPVVAKSVARGDIPKYLSTLTPYPMPKKTSALKAPAGFEPVFAENLARHGSRSITSEESIEDAIALWEDAKRGDALTAVGRRFGPDARALRTAMGRVGFGELSTLGRKEMLAIGAREGERMSSIFTDASAEGATVELIHSGRSRAQDSAEEFGAGLNTIHPELNVEPPESNENLLKFDNENNEYENFLEDGPWKRDYNRVRKISGIDDAAVDALKRLYKPDFVADVDDPLTQGNAIFDVYRAGPAMSSDVNVDTSQYMEPRVAETFAYVDDARYFYSRGPGVEGDDSTYQAAQILLDDFFAVIDDRREGKGKHPHAAVYRFAHAEEITPFAALLALPGNDEPGKPGETYTHENNDFRVDRVAQLSASINWTVWAKGETNIVSIRHNEVPTPVGRDCRPYKGTTMFYELAELRRCLGATE